MKIAILSDIHVGPSYIRNGIRRKLTEFSEEYIQAFVERVTSTDEISFGVHLGDLIQDANSALDRDNIRKALTLFRRSSKPMYHLIGNHDVKNLSSSEVLSLLDYSSPFYSFDCGHYHFVVLYSEVPDPSSHVSYISDEQLHWLQEDLLSSIRPTVVFCHHSFADQDLLGNPWFEGLPERCLVQNRVEVRDVLVRQKKVLCVLNGHLHWN